MNQITWREARQASRRRRRVRALEASKMLKEEPVLTDGRSVHRFFSLQKEKL